MKRWTIVQLRAPVLIAACSLGILVGCGGDDGGPEEEQTGTVLRGTVTSFQAQVVSGGVALAATEGVTVSIGSKSTVTDASGGFTLRDFGIATQDVVFSRDADRAIYVLKDIERGDTFLMDQVEINGGQVSTQHTGTWVGTGGSTDPSSQGQVALTMIIAQNGNSVTGTASIGAPDNTSWNITGTETGHTLANAHLTVTSTTSECAAGAELRDATFVADTLSGEFIEEDVPQDHECGLPEEGYFRVVKQ